MEQILGKFYSMYLYVHTLLCATMYECMYIVDAFCNIDNLLQLILRPYQYLLKCLMESTIFNRAAIFDTCLNIGL